MFKKSIFIIVILCIFIITSQAIANDVKITKPGYIAAISADVLSRAVEYFTIEDYEALQKLLDSRLIFKLNAGIKVQVMDIKAFGGMIKI